MKKLTQEKEKQIRTSFERQNLMKLFHAKIERIAEGVFEISVPYLKELTRTSGIFNGGVISALADTSAGYAGITLKEEGTYFLTVEMKISFLSPAQGEKLVAKGEVIKSGKTLTVSKADIFTVKEKRENLVATSLITFMQLTAR